MKRRFLAEAAVLIALAILCAGISNLAASPERRLAWKGDYPNALVVPPSEKLTPASAVVPPSQKLTPASAIAATSSAAAQGTAPATYAPHPDRPWVHITGQEAVALYERHIPFLDARRTAVYAEGHVAGARSFPVWETRVQEEIKKLVDEGYDQNAPLVIYCSGGDCEDSHMLAEKLYMFGFNGCLVYQDGFPDWEKRGQPIEKGLPH
jgi:rhodanese-related sulfurtransferase